MTKYLLIVFVLLSAVKVSAQHPNFTTVSSFGPKIGYTFGESGGLTAGLEVSYFPNLDDPASDVFRYGLTFDVTFWKGHFSMHLGAEVIAAYVIGIDLGPTFISDYKSYSVGLGTIAFAGMIFYPYYETILFSEIKHQSIGTYFKLPSEFWFGENGWWELN